MYIHVCVCVYIYTYTSTYSRISVPCCATEEHMGRMCIHARTQSERKRVIMREGEEERDNEN